MQQPVQDNITLPNPGSGAMFDAISSFYDKLNDILSLGMHRIWRRQAVAFIESATTVDILDIATGTGDLAILLGRRNEKARILGLDPSPHMLAKAVQKAAREQIMLTAIIGDAAQCPLPSFSVDIVTMAFGFRNMQHKSRVLAEVARILRPCGQLLILELTPPHGWAVGAVLRCYIRCVIPLLGRMFSRKAAYQHLANSIAAFPPRQQIAELFSSAGFVDTTMTPLSFGLCTIYCARTPLRGPQ